MWDKGKETWAWFWLIFMHSKTENFDEIFGWFVTATSNAFGCHMRGSAVIIGTRLRNNHTTLKGQPNFVQNQNISNMKT